MDGAQPLRPEPIESIDEAQQKRVAARSWQLGTGTLACPSCDAPVFLGEDYVTPGEPLSCPVCFRSGAVRDFLSLTPPTRPARVVVRLVPPVRVAAR